MKLRWLLIILCLALSSAWATSAADAPPLLLARVLGAATDPTDYWVRKKLDGVRAVWDGRELRFRSGRRVPAPEWFTASLPAEPLDGELWLGRRRFDELSAIVRKTVPVEHEWRQVRYMVFELPDAAGDFTARIERMRAIADASGNLQLHVVEQSRVADRTALMRRFGEVVKDGGEGLMLHRAASLYHTGLTDAARRAPPPIGALVTYRYTELTATGLPRFARYWRVREEF